MDLTRTLSHGYFPREVPTFFRSGNFALHAASLRARPAQPGIWTAATKHHLVRPGGMRRRVAAPNPFSQLELVESCVRDWSDLDTFMSGSPISLSRPLVQSDGRALGLVVPFDEHAAQRMSRLGRARFTLRADISDFYGSVYTHSLEWAIHSKASVKANMSKKRGQRQSFLGGDLDAKVRASQEGQTKGIPVGPDTSLLLSEIILCSVDRALVDSIRAAGTSALRVSDDLLFYAASRAEAEDVLLTWENLLGQYELSLNPHKTAIFEGPRAPEAPWSVHISQFPLDSQTDRKYANSLRRLFSLSLGLSADYPDGSVLSFALQRVDPFPSGQASWEVFFNLMMAAAAAEPSSLRYAANRLLAAKRVGVSIDTVRLGAFLNGICEYHAALEHGGVVVWALAIMRHFDISISQAAAGAVAGMIDNFCLILLRDLLSNGRHEGDKPDMSPVVERAEAPDVHLTSDWLLAYEFARNRWCSDGELRKQPHWKELLDRGVWFYRSITEAMADGSDSYVKDEIKFTRPSVSQFYREGVG